MSSQEEYNPPAELLDAIWSIELSLKAINLERELMVMFSNMAFKRMKASMQIKTVKSNISPTLALVLRRSSVIQRCPGLLGATVLPASDLGYTSW